jgi:thioredoxin reductase (NADPH)
MGLERSPGPGSSHMLRLANGERARARTVVIATGARYRRLAIAGIERLEGSSVHFWASPIEARLCEGQKVALVGGGNSAGQAAVYLAGHASRVSLVARRPLGETMSSYLVERIAGQANITVLERGEVTALESEGSALHALDWRRRDEEIVHRLEVRHLFLFIGADPNTDWLSGTGVKMDAGGFILTGRDAAPDRLPLETSLAGIFAAGDVRSGSVKRVAAAAGDGAQVVAAIHAYLERQGAGDA